ncbi:MAG: ParB/RepB/Spo0J family partition protein [Bacillota bacterium]|nr:ParB/RepB/Spo0J family partition protein [Bacillota bacterium]MDW7729033.1 ParB/RepB/Spo0J family partition protein [Bacillota bacterium]
MNEKRRLGKGLGALIPEVLAGTGESSEVELDRIKPNPYQPRQSFDEEKLRELTESIKEHGVLQAVVLSPSGDEGSYYLVAGERRCRAARKAGLTRVPAVIKAYDGKAMLEIALIENLQRENLNPIEEARAYQKLMKEFSYTQEELARKLGRSRPSVANCIRLLSLSEPLIIALEKGDMTSGQARPLLSISDPAVQQEAAIKIMSEGLTAREAEKIAAGIIEAKNKPGKTTMKIEEDPIQTELQLQIQRVLGTKVKIKPGKNGGTIEIYYYGEEDLERLVSKLLPEGL